MKQKIKKYWSIVSLRLALFRVWFMKNILVLLQIVGVTCIICILTGAIGPDTPFFGSTIYVIFAPIIDQVRAMIAEKEVFGIMKLFTASLTILSSVGIFAKKAKSIVQTDIKSDKLKIAMIRGGLYFDSNGKIAKKIEKATKTDINGDGLIDDKDTEPKQTKGFFRGIIQMIREFIAIATVEIDADDENKTKENISEVLEKHDMVEAVEATEEIEEIITKKENIDIDEIENIDEKQKKKSIFSSLKNVFRKEKTYETDEETVIITNNIPSGAKIEEEVKEPVVYIEEKKIEEPKQEEEKKTEVVEEKPQKKLSAQEQFLLQLQNRKK